MPRTLVSWLIAGVVAAMAACDPGSAEPELQGQAQAGEREVVDAKLLIEVTHRSGNVFSIYQHPDGSTLLVQRGKLGTPQVKLSPSALTDQSVTALYREIRPGEPVPEVLMQAERDFQHARSAGLLDTNWMSGFPRPSQVKRGGADTMPLEAEPTIDAELFRSVKCGDPGSDSLFRCFLDRINNWTYSMGRIAYRDVTTAMSTATGQVELTYDTCSYHVFCGRRVNIPIPQGFWATMHVGQSLYSYDYKVRPGASIWHFASTIPM